MVFRANAARQRRRRERQRLREQRQKQSLEEYLTGSVIPVLEEACKEATEPETGISKIDLKAALDESGVFPENGAWYKIAVNFIDTWGMDGQHEVPNPLYIRTEDKELFIKEYERVLSTEGKNLKVRDIQAEVDSRRKNRPPDTQARIDECRNAVSAEMRNFFGQLFDDYDDDNNEVLDRRELRHILADLEYKVTEAELDTMLLVFDADGSPGIDKDEFITMMASAVHPPHSVKELSHYFHVLDPQHLQIRRKGPARGPAGPPIEDDAAHAFFPKEHFTRAFDDLLEQRAPAEEEIYYWSASSLVNGLASVFFGSSGTESETNNQESESARRREYVRKLFLPAEQLGIDVSGKILGFTQHEDESAERKYRKSMRQAHGADGEGVTDAMVSAAAEAGQVHDLDHLDR